MVDPLDRNERLSPLPDAVVQEIRAELDSGLLTHYPTLDRLYKKGLVHRNRDGRAFVYIAALERHELEATMTTGLVNGMLAGGPGATRPFLSNLVDAVGDSDNGLLDELERLVRDKRERLKDKVEDDQERKDAKR